jgi:hypothetical protein
MSRKDYERIASVLAGVRQTNPDARVQLNVVSMTLADVFADDNPRFDRTRFLLACGVGR